MAFGTFPLKVTVTFPVVPEGTKAHAERIAFPIAAPPAAVPRDAVTPPMVADVTVWLPGEP